MVFEEAKESRGRSENAISRKRPREKIRNGFSKVDRGTSNLIFNIWRELIRDTREVKVSMMIKIRREGIKVVVFWERAK